ncbi:metallophosphoesterase [Paenibacillus aceris]|uniref:MPP superfamily phosphohydrolase n=1 Tax=Paenibacillus aceris TaxID=869555 RepID=A0ABS4HRH3_9BACL|nr:metallophosphoesterase [Paenibacillus aceris]MBP1961210.1 putative MPP superfamily phosphohydrolase [Paenibacillus aceris]NHW38000.1 metallophosphoesterase [Paenibacillus aceris]
MKTRTVLSITLIFAIIFGLNGYIGWHGQVFLSNQLGSWFQPGIYWVVFWIIALSYLLAWAGSKVLPAGVSRVLKIIGSYWLAIMQFGFLLLPLTDLIVGVLHLASVSASTYIPLLGWIDTGIIAIVMILGSYNARSPILRKYEITIPKKAGDWEQLRIAVASDIHLGSIVGNRHLRKLVKRVNQLKPDLILLPGDVIDDDIKPFIRYDMGSTMRELQAPLGIYAVLGNHEYIGGHIPAFVEQMDKIGIRVLMDETVHIQERLYIVGRKDKASERTAEGRKGLTALLEGTDLGQPIIVMDHQPYHLDKAEEAGADVMLSGHTHRGQISPNHLITRRLFELDWGYLRKGNLHAIVSSGFGTWGPPIRIGSRSEIIELIIQFKSNERKEE